MPATYGGTVIASHPTGFAAAILILPHPLAMAKPYSAPIGWLAGVQGVLIVCGPSYPPLTRHSRRSPVIPAAHPSYPPLTRHSRGSGNPYVLDVGLSLDKPKVHGKTGVVAKTKKALGRRPGSLLGGGGAAYTSRSRSLGAKRNWGRR